MVCTTSFIVTVHGCNGEDFTSLILHRLGLNPWPAFDYLLGCNYILILNTIFMIG